MVVSMETREMWMLRGVTSIGLKYICRDGNKVYCGSGGLDLSTHSVQQMMLCEIP